MDNKIIYILGKSGSGKNTIYRLLFGNLSIKIPLRPITMCTTRPKRYGEKNGVDYFFVSDSDFENDKRNNEIIEYREYNTVHGKWIYYTKNSLINLKESNYIGIGTPKSFKDLENVYGKKKMVPIYIDTINDYSRLLRCIKREMQNKNQNYKEICRRFLADEEDFSDNILSDINPFVSINQSQVECAMEIYNYLKQNYFPAL